MISETVGKFTGILNGTREFGASPGEGGFGMAPRSGAKKVV